MEQFEETDSLKNPRQCFFPELKAGDLVWVVDYKLKKVVPAMILENMKAFTHILSCENKNFPDIRHNIYTKIKVLKGDVVESQTRNSLHAAKEDAIREYDVFKQLMNIPIQSNWTAQNTNVVTVTGAGTTVNNLNVTFAQTHSSNNTIEFNEKDDDK